MITLKELAVAFGYGLAWTALVFLIAWLGHKALEEMKR